MTVAQGRVAAVALSLASFVAGTWSLALTGGLAVLLLVLRLCRSTACYVVLSLQLAEREERGERTFDKSLDKHSPGR